MALIKTFEAYDLKGEFIKADRDYFSLQACNELIDLFDQCGNVEIDIIGICCDFSEEDADYIIDNYSNIEKIAACRDEDGDVDINALMDALNYYTYAVQTFDNNILYQTF